MIDFNRRFSGARPRWRWAIGVSLAINVYIALADWAFVALHLRGWAQGVLGFLDGISAVLQVPGMALAIGLHIRHGHRRGQTPVQRSQLQCWTMPLFRHCLAGPYQENG